MEGPRLKLELGPTLGGMYGVFTPQEPGGYGEPPPPGKFLKTTTSKAAFCSILALKRWLKISNTLMKITLLYQG